jgi:hypothetical protein
MKRLRIATLRQQLWRAYQALGRTLRAMTPQTPVTPGSFYLMRRKCGKPSCRCARGQLHPAWVLTRSEAGRHKLYSVPDAQRAQVRQRAVAWRHSQHARARFVKQTAALLDLADRMVQAQTVAWPAPQPQPRSRS